MVTVGVPTIGPWFNSITVPPAQYVLGAVRFYRDGVWQQYAAPRVEGRTREEWARSGQDVAVFDAAVAVADAAIIPEVSHV